MTQHRILDTRMRPKEGEIWTICTCGQKMEAEYPLELADAFRDHRKEMGERDRRPSEAPLTGNQFIRRDR